MMRPVCGSDGKTYSNDCIARCAGVKKFTKGACKKPGVLPGTKLKCGSLAGPICMGYNLKCFSTTLAGCKSTCKKTVSCKIAEYAAGSKTCCTSAIATKKACKGSFVKSSAWKGYVVCGAPMKKTTKKKVPTLPGTKLKCGSVAGPICMGYNLKCWRTTLAICKSTCKKTRGCKIAEYSTTGTCCTSAIATKKACKGSFTTSSAWKGYVVCGAPKATTKKAPTLPGTSLKCGADAGPICMGYNIKCWRTTLATCKSTCKKTRGCKIAEYAASSKTCCTSAIATKKAC